MATISEVLQREAHLEDRVDALAAQEQNAIAHISDRIDHLYYFVAGATVTSAALAVAVLLHVLV